MPSLEEYVLVAQDEAKIEIHRRRGDIGWEIVTLTPGDPVELKSLEFASADQAPSQGLRLQGHAVPWLHAHLRKGGVIARQLTYRVINIYVY